MNPLIFKELQQFLENKAITVTIAENKSCHECYIVKDILGAEIIRYTHTNIDKNVYELCVLNKKIIYWVNPAHSTEEMRMLLKIVDLIKQKDKEQSILINMTEQEKKILQTLRYINGTTR